MSDLIDPGKGARRQAREQAELLKRQKQKEQLKLAEAEDELAKKKAKIMTPRGRAGRSMLTPASQTGARMSLG